MLCAGVGDGARADGEAGGGTRVVAEAARGLLANESALTAAGRPWSASRALRWFSSGGRVSSERERGSSGRRVFVS